MSTVNKSGTFALGGTRSVARLGYGAMQLAGPGIFGPPKDPETALAVLREAVASGVNHIDTSDFYGPHVTNHLIRKALHPYADDLVIVTKIGARRGADGSWLPAFSPKELTEAVHDNLRNLGVDALDVVNLRSMHGIHEPAEGSIEQPLSVLAELQRKGLVRQIGRRASESGVRSTSACTTTSTPASRPASAGSRTSATRQVTPAMSPRRASIAITFLTDCEAASLTVRACPMPPAAPVTATTGIGWGRVSLRSWRTGRRAFVTVCFSRDNVTVMTLPSCPTANDG
jgi:hypothetical protein